MTEHEVDLAIALGDLGPAATGRRFARDMCWRAKNEPMKPITLRQRHYLELLAWRYRRQLPEDLVPDRKPPNLPAPVKETKKRTRRTKAVVAQDRSNQGDLF